MQGEKPFFPPLSYQQAKVVAEAVPKLYKTCNQEKNVEVAMVALCSANRPESSSKCATAQMAKTGFQLL